MSIDVGGAAVGPGSRGVTGGGPCSGWTKVVEASTTTAATTDLCLSAISPYTRLIASPPPSPAALRAHRLGCPADETHASDYS